MSSRYVVLVSVLSLMAAGLSSATPVYFEAPQSQELYKAVSESVSLIETVNEAGQIEAIGSAFLVDDQRLITNHHVVERGRIYLKVGSVRVECLAEKTDVSTDLALLRMQGSIAAKPLVLSTSETPIGSVVFAFGNPAGLERSITQGLLSGIREVDGRTLLQISAAISPGSSGGPVVNERGEVIGVAVASLKDGQNLNFAIPTRSILALIEGKPLDPGVNLEILLKRVSRLSEEVGELFKADAFDESQWKQKTGEISDLLLEAKNLAGDSPEKLLMVAHAASEASNSTIARDVAESAVRLSKSPLFDAHRLLAEVIQRSSWFLEDEEEQALLQEAEKHARKVVSGLQKPESGDFSRLALILESLHGRQLESYSYFKRALEVARANKEGKLAFYYRGLFRLSRVLGHNAEALTWFKAIAEEGEIFPFDYEGVAAVLEEEERYAEAGDYWMKSASSAPNAERFCGAGRNYWIAGKNDEALAAYRRCIERGTTEQGSEVYLAGAYSTMSAILFERGVYDESIKFARQALELRPDDGFANYHLSRSLNAVNRNAEAVVAAQNAIRLTDGRYSDMHFALGVAYFAMENWAQAARAFEKAAELDQSGSASAYNVALCLQNQGFYGDAASWYEEVLKRDPNHPKREDIRKRIQAFRR